MAYNWFLPEYGTTSTLHDRPSVSITNYARLGVQKHLTASSGAESMGYRALRFRPVITRSGLAPPGRLQHAVAHIAGVDGGRPLPLEILFQFRPASIGFAIGHGE